MEELKQKLFYSFFWKMLEKLSNYGIQLILQIILARLLAPSKFGIISISIVFINIATVFFQGGFSEAIIQKQDSDNKTYSSVLYFSMAISIICYIILYISSDYIAGFYKIRELNSVLKILGTIFFIGPFVSIQEAILRKNMEFKILFTTKTIAAFISGIIGVITAYMNYGIWALVIQHIINNIFIALLLYTQLKWIPMFTLSVVEIKSLFSFGWKLQVSSFIDTLYKELTNLIIGKKYVPSVLAFYTRGSEFPQVIVGSLNNSIQSVIFPALASIQSQPDEVKKLMRRGIMLSSYIIFPSMIGLFVIAEPLVRVLLTDKWLSSVPYIRIFCLSYALWPIHTTNLQAINAIGRSDIFLKLEIIKKISGIIIIFITYRYSPYIMAIGVLANGIIGSFINAYPNQKLLNYSYLEQLKDIYPSFVISLIMGIGLYYTNYLKISDIFKLVLQLCFGCSIYMLLSYIFKVESYIYIVKTIKNYKRS